MEITKEMLYKELYEIKMRKQSISDIVSLIIIVNSMVSLLITIAFENPIVGLAMSLCGLILIVYNHITRTEIKEFSIVLNNEEAFESFYKFYKAHANKKKDTD